MTQPIAFLDGPWWPYLALILFAVLPTEIWRWLAVAFARRLDEQSPWLEWVRLVATSLLAGVVAKLVLTAPGALAGVPLAVRLAALAVAVVIVLLSRSKVMLAVLAGEAVLIGGALWLG
ncbi:AzlD domain-containing protein [Bosea sp. NPDC003192]|jgi:branched-subunit amino acid transport protein|uniref:AzlD domain-containing protein n=1 Tax=Bosea sp. NPDC003192 TaxID=3390551 RepID=UPI003D00BD4B